MKADLQGKVALVTGVSDGIGGAVSRSLAGAGARVVCTGIQTELVDAVATSIIEAGGEALALHLDVRSEDDWGAAIDAAIATFSALDILVNNAGILHVSPLMDTSLEAFRRVYEVNVDGVFLGLREGVRAMRPGGVAGKGGSIISISSVAATAATVNHVAYGSSKAAVSGMTRHAACECAAHGDGIRINAICPGVVRTNMLIDTPENIARMTESHALGLGETSDIAHAALYLASDASRWVTGTELTVDGGYRVRA